MKRGDIFCLAHGTVGAFVGRNNDVGGYWAIGKLCLHAVASGAAVVAFDLLAGSAAPAWPSAVEAGARAAARLDRHLGALRLSRSVLQSAALEVRFEPVPEEAALLRYRCIAHLIDARGRAARASAAGTCWPHDPSRELRSAR